MKMEQIIRQDYLMKVITKENAAKFLDKLRSHYKVVVPCYTSGELTFGDTNPNHQIIDYQGLTHYSPKGYFFPESEALFTFELTGQGKDETISIKEHMDETKTVIWGVRPCDLNALKVLDIFFLSDPVDPYYKAKRMNTLIFALNCNKVGKNCFCGAVDAGPFIHKGFDLGFTDLGDEFLVEISSETGENLIKNHSVLFAEASREREEKAKALEQESRRSFISSLDIEKLKAKLLLPKTLKSPIWEEQITKCKVCGTCSFVCPTCHCFNIEDLKKSKKVVQRMRYWDSCQLSGFTQMAGHNSRPSQAERWRHKVYDKFFYLPNEFNRLIGCVGCGRCVDFCQADIKIVEVLRRIADGE